MPRNKNETKSEGNIGMYVAAGVFGAAAAAIGYYFGKNSESSHSQYSHRDTPRDTPRDIPATANSNYVDTDCDCTVCLDSFKPTIVLPCKHRLHAECVKRWFAECETRTAEGEDVIYTCPKCNQSVDW